jgi:hypothetical protein
MRRSGNTKVQYIAQLGDKHEDLVIIRHLHSGRALVQYSRFGAALCVFVAGPAQLKKMAQRRGRISISQKQITDGNLYASGTYS